MDDKIKKELDVAKAILETVDEKLLGVKGVRKGQKNLLEKVTFIVEDVLKKNTKLTEEEISVCTENFKQRFKKEILHL